MNRNRYQLKHLSIVLSSSWFWLVLYSGLGLIGVLNHVMWRDEFNTWLIVRDSNSLGEMLQHVKYQGHTALWALCLSLLRNFYDSYLTMQLFHWAIAVASAVIFWRYSPFTFRQKLLFTFGYIPIYQYSLVARPYVLGMLCLFAFCAVFPYRQKSYIPAAMLLMLMINSSAYALLMALALAATLVIEWILNPKARSRDRQYSHALDLMLSVLIFAVGFGFAVYILTPPIDSYNHGGLDAWQLNFNLRRTLRAWNRIFAGYTLIVPSQYRWIDLWICGAITLFSVSVFALQLVKRWLSLVFFMLANLTLLAFTYFRFAGIGPRHFAHFYLILIAAFWLYAYLPEADLSQVKSRLVRRSLALAQNWHQPLLTTILVIQFLGGLYVYPRDLLIPFSASKAVSNYIQTSAWQDEFIVASRDANMAPISGYLDRQLYYPELESMGSFTLFGGDRESDNHENYLPHTEVLRQVEQLLIERDLERILLILHLPLETTTDILSVQPIHAFTRAWTPSERYYLYWVTLPNSVNEASSYLPSLLG